jgi:hypothetical protein
VKVIEYVAKFNKKETWLHLDNFEAVDRELSTTSSLDQEGQAEHEKTDRSVVELGPIPSTSTSEKLGGQKPEWKWKIIPPKVRALFCTPQMAVSTTLIILIWMAGTGGEFIFNSFAPFYLQAKIKDHLVKNSVAALDFTYRNYALLAACSVPGYVIAGFAVEVRYIGRKGTGAICNLSTAIFLFLFTRSTTYASITGISCAIGFFLGAAHGLQFGITPELFPAPIRGTGQGLAASAGFLAQLLGTIVAIKFGFQSNVSVWISAGLFALTGLLYLSLPFETRGRAAS